ncbi:TPA: PBSX family phage terminase large subunit [Enterococcus faecium]|uniref:PBSX family phage terminase large subunit n=1 Tax=Enterococcus faecium TaxID=1352 RepID=UPI000DE9B2E2|nr:PBSX family phage terminase large subunit [Enterococcus faecium]RBS81832.1 PBSX family phage terminase, large subunit [Enterococcus faecium]HEM3777431.1 PBSX family phage terminase large subunit [Enterococcus faecium]
MVLMAKKQTQIKTTDLINPHFYKVWHAKCPYILMKGGRGSFKSSVISLKLATEMKKHTQAKHKVNVVCMMSQHKYLRDAVYEQIKWALSMLGISKEYKFRTSPLRIIHKRTGSKFYFYGVDDPLKLKSNAIGDVIALWYEEAANFESEEVFDQTNATFIRQRSPWVDQVQVYYSWNPPKNPYDWVNEWVEKCIRLDDHLVDHSTYKDDELGFTDPQQLKLIETYRENDEDYYRWLYLGEVIGLGTLIYNMDHFHPLDELPDDDYIVQICFSIDSGHQISATTCGCYAITKKKNVILLDTYYYSPEGKVNKKAPDELSKDLHDFIERCQTKYNKYAYKITIDSAEGALKNQYYKDYNERFHAVAKAKKVDMIDYVQNLLAQGRFFYLDTEANRIFIKEHRDYRWDEDTLQSDDPKVIKVGDHTCDQFQYFVKDNLSDLGLKW